MRRRCGTFRRFRPDDSGFTLIELMVVVLIIGVLMAIAIPTFLGARSSAAGRQAQAVVRNAYTSEMAALTGSQAYVNSVSSMSSIEPGISWGQFGTGTGWAVGNRYAYIEGNTTTSPGAKIVIGALGADQSCYWILGIDGQPYFQKAPADPTAGCALPTTPAWSRSWGSAPLAAQPDASGVSSAA